MNGENNKTSDTGADNAPTNTDPPTTSSSWNPQQPIEPGYPIE